MRLEKFGGSTGTPLYQDEDHPLHGKHIKVAPSSPQWQHKLEAPLRVVLGCSNSHPDHNSSSRLTILWKTLTILSPVQDAEFYEDITAWARLHYFQSEREFRGCLEVVQELRDILEGPPVETPRSLPVQLEKAQAASAAAAKTSLSSLEKEPSLERVSVIGPMLPSTPMTTSLTV